MEKLNMIGLDKIFIMINIRSSNKFIFFCSFRKFYFYLIMFMVLVYLFNVLYFFNGRLLICEIL